ncbi:N-acetylglucosamine-6-phosphate deacetylase [Paucisalibacillus sp. EB02]|uniref:N-acetylglucosamine-6-phosphate deacetylase n=1 Tax=Paucisalibacillus sp. EB02 TaxID=1347087 RepID=UPI0004AD64A0|nr:N-acetylglucosamine-6-phosphate deacetylase [Paucisalibacillus sp. EB02]
MFYLYGDVVTEGNILTGRYVEVSASKITDVSKEKRHQAPVVSVDGYICPGFIDVHIHGVDGVDVMDERSDSIESLAGKLPSYGVTSFLATSRTASLKDVTTVLEKSRRLDIHPKSSRFLGVHLEGPWISSTYKGAQPETYIRKLTWEDVYSLLEPYKDIIRKITFAPEEVTDITILDYLKQLGINLSAGHTNATMEEMEDAIKHGVNQVTHIFNAMSGLHHREPGVVGTAMHDPELFCEIIADGLHVHPKMIELLFLIKGKERIVLISDCTGYNHLVDGEYFIRNKKLVKNGNKVSLKSGQLAGSANTLNDCFQFAVNQCHIPLKDAVFMVTETPLNMIEEKRAIGKVKVGYQADIVILDRNLQVERTYIAGDLCYERGL